MKKTPGIASTKRSPSADPARRLRHPGVLPQAVAHRGDDEAARMGDFLTAFTVSALLILTPLAQGAPSPAPAETSQSPLKEIGHVRATTAFCRAALEHTLVGVSIVLDNDVRLGHAKGTMQRVYANPDPLAKNNGLQSLLNDYVALRVATLNGRRAIKQLKSEAERAPTDEQKMALITLANALDGALVRQKILGDVVGRFALYVDSHQPIEDEQLARMLIDPSRPGAELTFPRVVIGPVSVAPSQVWSSPKHDIAEIDDSARPLASDEAAAADRIDPAFSHC